MHIWSVVLQLYICKKRTTIKKTQYEEINNSKKNNVWNKTVVQLLGARKNIDKLVQCFMVTPQLKWELNKNREKCNDTRFGLSSRTQNGAGSIFRSHFVCGFGFCIIISFFRPTFVYFFLSRIYSNVCVLRTKAI